MKKVSVIIPTKNRAPLLKIVLDTYLEQENIGELIIINDGSTDNTKELIQQFIKKDVRVKYLENVNGIGATAARNLGVSRAIYEYVYYGEDDMYLKEKTLSILLDHMDVTGADVISGRRIWMSIGETEKTALERANKAKGFLVNNVLVTTNCELLVYEDKESELLDASMLIKKHVFDLVQYDTRYKRNSWREETDFQISCREKGFKLVFCPHVATFHLPKINDKGGNHSSRRLQYELNILKNDNYFMQKHSNYLKTHMGVSLFKHYVFFLFDRIVTKNLFPVVVSYKKKLFSKF